MTDPTNTPHNTGSTPATGGQTPGEGGTGYTGDTAYPDQPVASRATAQPAGTGGFSGSDSTKDVAKSEATDVKDTAVDSGKRVAETAKQEAGEVVQEAKQQARQVLDTGIDEVRTQAGSQQQRAAEGVRSIAQELNSMAGNAEGNGLATKVVGDLGRQADEIAGWLQNREPADILNEVQRFAARRPGLFLGICAGLGVLAGRAVRGLQADRADSGDDYDTRRAARSYDRGYDTRGYDTAGSYSTGQQGGGFSAYSDPTLGRPQTQPRDYGATGPGAAGSVGTGVYSGSQGASGDSYEADRVAGEAPEYQGRDDAGTSWTNEGERR